MALKITKKAAKADVTTTMSTKGKTISEDHHQEEVDVPAAALPTPDPHCSVGVEMSYTHNLGDYKSARVQVSLNVPCAHSEVDEVYDYAKGWCDSKLESLISDLTGE